MGYIEPNTSIELYRNVPLDKSYRHTTKYSNASAQYNDFQQYLYKKYDKQSYQRWSTGTIKIEETFENLFGVNYMIFYNNMGGTVKKVYAFVTGYDYISNNVSQLYYSIDYLQTHMFDYYFLKSYIERNHVYSDIQGTETEPEGLELGPMYVNDGFNGYAGIGGAWHYLILATQYPSGQPFNTPRLINGIFCGLYYYDTTNADNFSNVIQQYIEQGLEDSIVSLYMGPPNTGDGADVTMKIQLNKISGYKPNNMKLLTYPYRYLEISNNLGITEDLKIEKLSGPNKSESGTYWNFSYYITSLNFPQPILIFHPYYSSSGSAVNQSYELQYSVFPTCAFAGDSYKVWWAQNKNSYLAAMNNITTTYDTSTKIASINYDQATLNARVTSATQQANAEASRTTAEVSKNATMDSAQNSYNQVYNSLDTGALLSGAMNFGYYGSTTDLLNEIGENTFIKYSDLGTQISNSLSSSRISADVSLANAGISANASYNNTNTSATIAIQNANLAYEASLKNASLSKEAADLSALTSSQVATANLVAKKSDAEHQPSSVHGQSVCDGANVYMGRVGFTFQLKSIDSLYAQKIDNYFDLYGYAIRRLEVPSVDNRKHYTYLKTVGCQIRPTGKGFDSATKNIIEGIYNNGVTTWKKLSEVGDYTLASDNTPNGSQY